MTKTSSKQEILCGDCLEVMKTFPDKSFDLVLTDPPYGITACSWDSVIPFDLMWEQLMRITKKNRAIVLFGSQPFTSALIMSNPKMFRYEWVWDKVNKRTGFLNAKHSPLKAHENILVFSKETSFYNPIFETGKSYKKTGTYDSKIYGNKGKQSGFNDGKRYPLSIISIKGDDKKNGFYHPTQKPVALMEYLIKTYTNEGEVVLDFTMGSGTTLVAAKQLNRNAVGIEISPEYCEIARQRLRQDVLL